MKLIPKFQTGNILPLKPQTFTNKVSYKTPADSTVIGATSVNTKKATNITPQSAYHIAKNLSLLPKDYTMNAFLSGFKQNAAELIPSNSNLWFDKSVGKFMTNSMDSGTTQISPEDAKNLKMMGKRLPTGRLVSPGVVGAIRKLGGIIPDWNTIIK